MHAFCCATYQPLYKVLMIIRSQLKKMVNGKNQQNLKKSPHRGNDGESIANVIVAQKKTKNHIKKTTPIF